MKKLIFTSMVLVSLSLFITGFGQKVNWESYMSSYDMVWNRLPGAWDEAPFMGNGTLGLMMYKPANANFLQFDVGNSAVQDHRSDAMGNIAYSRCRLPIGYFTINPVGQIEGGQVRLALWNALTEGTVKTSKGKITISSFVHATRNIMVIRMQTTDGEQEATMQWHPLKAVSPRQSYGIKHNMEARIMKGYPENPAGEMLFHAGINLYVQPLLAGGQTVTAWKQKTEGQESVLLINVSHSFPAMDAEQSSLATLREAEKLGYADLLQQHQAWWHDFFPKSFISIPDKKLESFYWIQLYKMASATRADGVLIDNQGPWLQETPWPLAWWNLNVQLTYWLANGSNHPDLGLSLSKTLAANSNALVENVPEPFRHNSAGIGRASGPDLISKVDSAWTNLRVSDNNISSSVPEIGLLTWTMHNVWLQYRHTMDLALLKDLVYPLLRKSVNYYLHFVRREQDGKYHLPYTYSPEYGIAKDANFDLALLKWGLQTLMETVTILNINDELVPVWKDISANLVGFPQDEQGFRIGADKPYSFSHRHYSHMLMLYPLYLVNKEQDGAKDIMMRTMKHWHSMPEALEGYSYTGAASIFAAFGEGDSALHYLKRLFQKFLRPNTMYAESGPVIETPLSGGQAILDMLLQSWSDKIRIFPALPTDWKAVQFADLKAEGAFLVSAKREHGKTTCIKIKSLAGMPCRIETDMVNPVVWQPSASRLKTISPGVYEIQLEKGKEVVLGPKGMKLNLNFKPAPADKNYFGLN